MLKKIISVTLMLLASNSFAGSSTGTFKSSATLASTCSINITDINIGNIQFGVTNNIPNNINEGYGTLSVHCTKNTAYKVQQTFNDPVTLTGDPYGYLRSTSSSDFLTVGLGYYINNGYTNWAKYPLTAIATGNTDTFEIVSPLINTSSTGGASETYPTPGQYTGTATLILTY